MKLRDILAWTLPLALGLTGAKAADFSDPTWPCIQRKVETLSLGLMWPYPLDPEAEVTDPALRADIDELSDYLSLRSIDPEQLQPRIEAFAERHNGDPEILGQAFAATFDTLSKRRARIMSGIESFSLGQITLAEKIDANRAAMDSALAADTPDYDRIDTLEEQLDWDQVIYSDRQRNITYLCETPTLLEKRLFSIAQMLGEVVRDDG